MVNYKQVIKCFKNSEGREINIHWSGQERLSRWNRTLAGLHIVIEISKEDKKDRIHRQKFRGQNHKMSKLNYAKIIPPQHILFIAKCGEEFFILIDSLVPGGMVHSKAIF